MRLIAATLVSITVLWQALTVNAILQTYGSCTMNGLLAQCLGYDGKACRYPEYERCTQLNTLRQKINCYCKFFQNQADCWGQGRCCTEWPAHASVAKQVCDYAKLPDSKLDAGTMKKMREAGYEDVIMRVCNNDCQTDCEFRFDIPSPVFSILLNTLFANHVNFVSLLHYLMPKCRTKPASVPCRDDEPMPRNGQNPSGKCQPRTYWSNGKCTGRQPCASYDRIKRRELSPAAMPDTFPAA